MEEQSRVEASCRLSVVVPVYNEERRLAPSLKRIAEYLGERSYESEIVIVDDGSSDGTVEIAEQAGLGSMLRLIKHEVNRGKGAAVRTGMEASNGEFALFSDADLSTPIEEIEKFWPHFGQGCDVVIGSRGLPDSSIEVHQGFPRELMGKVFNRLVRWLVVPGIYDTQCGFKMFSRRAANTLFANAKLDGWAFDVEVLALAVKSGFRVAEVPVRWVNSEDTKVRPIRAASQMFRDLLRLRRRFR